MTRTKKRSKRAERPSPHIAQGPKKTQTIGLPRRSKLSLELMDDHRLILADFELLRASAQHKTNQPSQDMFLGSLEKSLGDHFQKEERLLFPLLLHSLGPTIRNQLNTENQEMLTIAKNLNSQSSSPEEPFKRLEKLLRTHISMEENVLFWYLDVQGVTDPGLHAVTALPE